MKITSSIKIPFSQVITAPINKVWFSGKRSSPPGAREVAMEKIFYSLFPGIDH